MSNIHLITRKDWAISVCHGLALPITTYRLQAFIGWANGECGYDPARPGPKFNPFATTQFMPGADAFNTFGNGNHVWNYRDYADGLAATIRTLNLHYYTDIRAALTANAKPLTVAQAIAASPWGTGIAAIHGTEHAIIHHGPDGARPIGQ